ncbi:MAG: hypothetical protein NVSMB10_09570 [Steroidobacteraceae bacterium]
MSDHSIKGPGAAANAVDKKSAAIQPTGAVPPKDSADPKGTTDEAIGRPSEWREGRYEEAGKTTQKTVNDPAQREEKAPDTTSTPVTRRDYEK